MSDETRLLYLSRDEIQPLQLARLNETLQRAKRAPYFVERFANVSLHSLADLASLPLTTKDDLRAASPFDCVAVPHAELFQYHESSSTTGSPSSSWLTRADFEAFAAQINQGAVDFHAEDLVVNRFPYAISVPAHIIKLAAQNRGACVVSASTLSPICTYTRTIELLRKLRATVLMCLPTEATLLAETARAMDMNPTTDFNLRAIGTAGEMLTDARRRRIEQTWRCKVFNYYGTTETGNLAADCHHQRMHLAWDHFLMEVLDEHTRKPLPDGQPGMPVVTTLTRQAMPLVRYAITDLLRLHTHHNCPCGRRSPIVHHLGRDANRFRFQDRSISMADLEDRLFRLPEEAVGNIWMIVVTPERVYFRVEARRQDAALYRKTEADIGRQFDLPLVIDAVPPGSLFPMYWLLEPPRIGKPAYYCEARSLDAAPQNLPELWIGPGAPPPGMEFGPESQAPPQSA